MSAFADLSELVNRLTGGNSGTPEFLAPWKSYTISGTADSWVAGLEYSTWKYDGFPGGASNPGAVAAPTKATTGAIPFTNPSGGREKWLVQACAIAANRDQISGLWLYDRLLHISGLDGTVFTPTTQTVGGTLTRHTGGAGNQIWVEIYSAVGTTQRTITASYTNQSGSSGRTTQSVTFGGTVGSIGNDDNLIIRLPLQAGDTGVQAVASVTIGTGSTGAAGNFGVTVAHPLALIPFELNSADATDFTVGPSHMPEIDTDACLAMTLLAGSTTETPLYLALSTVER